MVFDVVLSLSGLSNQIGVFYHLDEQNKNINPLELVIVIRKLFAKPIR